MVNKMWCDYSFLYITDTNYILIIILSLIITSILAIIIFLNF